LGIGRIQNGLPLSNDNFVPPKMNISQRQQFQASVILSPETNILDKANLAREIGTIFSRFAL